MADKIPLVLRGLRCLGLTSRKLSNAFVLLAYASVFLVSLVATSYGLFVWPCAPLLAQYVFHRRSDIINKHVLEIGCGTSLPGVTAAKLGAKVTLSDSETLPLCLERARQSCAANGLHDVAVLPITWGTFGPNLVNLAPVDIVLGSDCFYDTKDFEPIIVTISYLFEKNPKAEFWTTYQIRSIDQSLEHLLCKWNLSCKHVSNTDFCSTSHIIDSNSPELDIDHDPRQFQMLIITKNNNDTNT